MCCHNYQGDVAIIDNPLDTGRGDDPTKAPLHFEDMKGWSGKYICI